MICTKVQLTEQQMERLRRLSAARGVSIAALIREAVDRAVDDDGRERDWELALSVVGKYRDRHSAKDVSSNIDEHAAEAYEH